MSSGASQKIVISVPESMPARIEKIHDAGIPTISSERASW
jgi:hypothetical protein